jgi:hypothetical protein
MGPHPHPIVDLGPVALAGRRACYGGGRHLAVARALRPADLRPADWRSGDLRSSCDPWYRYGFRNGADRPDLRAS